MDTNRRDPSDSALSAGYVITSAVRMYRRFPRRVLGTAVAVFAPVLVLETGLHRAFEALHVGQDLPAAVATLLVVATTAITITFAELLFSGVMDESVGATLDGAPLPEVGTVVRFLPLGTLLVADLLLVLLVFVGTALFVVPGVVVLTLTCIAGPVIVVERPSALRALRRSAALVRPWFGTAMLAVAVPLIAEGIAIDWLIRGVFGLSWAVVAVSGALFGVTVGAIVGLCEVVLGRTLIRLDRARAQEVSASANSSKFAM